MHWALDKVEAVLLPSRYTQDMSNEDAVLEAEALGVHYHIIPIEPAVNALPACWPIFLPVRLRTPPKKHPGALPRRGVNGAVEQAGQAVADHRQQE